MRTIWEFFKKLIPDSIFLRIKFRMKMGKPLHLRHPQTFNEKLQWLKLHDRNPEYTKLVDKYEVKNVVADLIGEQYIIPTYGIWNSFDEIDFGSLPDQFVLKCTHDSGGIVICTDKKTLDIDAARDKINKCLKRNYYWVGREWPYKNVKPRIIAEKYIVDESGYELKDYKVFNFNSTPKVIQVDFDRFADHMRNLYDTDWNYIEGEIKYKSNPERKIAKPECFEEMLSVSKKLSEKIPHVRTDFYCINNRLYFGDLTIYHASDFSNFQPEELGLEFDSWLDPPSYGAEGYLVSANDACLWIHPSTNNSSKKELPDYKLLCFNGEAKIFLVCTERFSESGLKETFYNNSWEKLPFKRACHETSSDSIPVPKQFQLMQELAHDISKDIPFARVDFYEVNGDLYFGEVTFYPSSGFEGFNPEEWDYTLGEMLTLS